MDQHRITLHMPQALLLERRDDILVFKHSHQSDQQTDIALEQERNREAILPIPGSISVPGTPWQAKAEVLPDAICQHVSQALLHEDWQTVWQLLPRANTIAYIDATILGTAQRNLLVRSRRPGDRIQPLGMSREKKVKDVLIDEHIPYEQRQSIPLFFSSTHCLWIGGVRLDDRARLRSHTGRIIRLTINTDN
jgi:tRNA(Ile)-lysidine synthase